MYEKSLALEPREREDEKIARYATTTGREINTVIMASMAALR